MKVNLSADRRLLLFEDRHYVFVPHPSPRCHLCAFHPDSYSCTFPDGGLARLRSCDTRACEVSADGYWARVPKRAKK